MFTSRAVTPAVIAATPSATAPRMSQKRRRRRARSGSVSSFSAMVYLMCPTVEWHRMQDVLSDGRWPGVGSMAATTAAWHFRQAS